MPDGKWIVKYYGTEEMRWFTSLEKATDWAYKKNRSTNDHWISWLWFMHPRKTTLEYCGEFQLADDPLDSWDGGDSETFQALKDERVARKKAEYEATIPPGAVEDARELVRSAGWELTATRIPNNMNRTPEGRLFDPMCVMDTILRTAKHPDKPYRYDKRDIAYNPDFDERGFAASIALAENLCPAHPRWKASNWNAATPSNL